MKKIFPTICFVALMVSCVLAQDPPLERVLEKFTARYKEVTALIPNPFLFEEGDSGNNIGDGGEDMFDGGCYVGTNIAMDIDYSDMTIIDSEAFGENSRYFTAKFEGLFLLAAENHGASEFYAWSNYGADGSGQANTYDFTDRGYTCYALNVFDAVKDGDEIPGVHKLIVFQGGSNPHKKVDLSSNEGEIKAEDISDVTRIYFLFFATEKGKGVTQEEEQAIFNKVVDILWEQEEAPPKEPTPQEPATTETTPEKCVILYDECDFQGQSISVCESKPQIPEDMKQFEVKSVKVPQGIRVTFFKEEFYVDSNLQTNQSLNCLTNPFTLSFLQFQTVQNLRKQLSGANSIVIEFQ